MKITLIIGILSWGVFQSVTFCAEDILLPKVIDLGSLEGGALATTEILIKNAGSHEVKIDDIRASCSCTNLRLVGSPKIEVHGERRIKVSILYSPEIGRHETRIAIFTNDANPAETNEYFVTIRAQVVTPLILDRNTADFGDVKLGAEPPPIVITGLRGNSDTQWDEIQPIYDEDGHLKIGVTDVSPTSYIFTVHFNPTGLPIASFRQVVKLQLLKNRKPIPSYMNVCVMAKVTGSLKAVPSSVFLGALTPGQHVTRSFVISSDNLDLRRLTIAAPPRSVTAKVADCTARSATISVNMVAPGSLGPYSEKLVVSHPSNQTRLAILLIGVIEPKSDDPQSGRAATSKSSEDGVVSAASPSLK